MALELQPEQVLNLALVPIDRGALGEADDGRRCPSPRIKSELDVHPRGVCILVKYIGKRPASLGRIVHDQRRERITQFLPQPLANRWQFCWPAFDSTGAFRVVEFRDDPPLPSGVEKIDDARRSWRRVDYLVIDRHGPLSQPPMAVAAARRSSCKTGGT